MKTEAAVALFIVAMVLGSAPGLAVVAAVFLGVVWIASKWP